MKLLDLFKIELLKVKHSKIMIFICIAPLLVVISGVTSVTSYFTEEYIKPWEAMFIQSTLLYAYYLLPFSMIVVCIMIENRERKNNGIRKILSLPINRRKVSIIKFSLVVCILLLEIFIFFIMFLVAGIVAINLTGISEVLPVITLIKWCVVLFCSMVPAVAVVWAITVLFENPVASLGLNFLMVIPGVLIANTSAWNIYPYCYSGYLVSCSLKAVTGEGGEVTMRMIPFVIYAILITGFFIVLSVTQYGKKIMK